MARLSEHTKLVNALLGFTLGTPGWPPLLKSAGYQVENIEPRFLNSDSDMVNPDLLFSSNSALHILVTECKRGHIDEETLRKYDAIAPENLRTEIDKVYNVNEIDNETVYCGTEKTEESFEYHDITDAGIIFTESVCSRLNDFADPDLNESIGEETLPAGYPTQYYPFSPNDSRAVIASKVGQHLISEAASGKGPDAEISAEDVASSIFRFWEETAVKEKQAIVTKIEDILSLLDDRNIDENMRHIEGERRYYVNSSQAFQRKVKEIMDELSTEEDLERFL